MKKKNISLSIIIINYKVKVPLLACIQSIIDSKPKTRYEIIVVDNDEKKSIKQNLLKKFPSVIYVPNKNKGFGQGNNVGAEYAKGEYYFILNPDTKLLNNGIDALVTYLKSEKSVGMVAPLLYDKDNNPYPVQGLKRLTPFRSIFVLSFINKIFPQNNIFKDYAMTNWDKEKIKMVDVVPGTAFIIRSDLFKQLEGFDERFFLYFEEFDLCNRLRALGWKICINPSAKVYHAWGLSTIQRNDTDAIFNSSRFYYFRKHYGLLLASAIDLFLRINKFSIVMLLSILIGFFIASYRIGELMPFLGDFGWFYLSARDVFVTHTLPLVGIASSHPWIHQGALWTYMLAITLRVFDFNPVSGAYISIAFFLATIGALYKIGSEIFSKRIGVISTFLYATSPLVILNARTPYHTSPIPFLTVIFYYALYKWIKGNKYYFPITIATLALLYNLEIATFPLTFVFLMIFIVGLFKKTPWIKNLFNPTILLLSIIAYILPMLPMLIYDVGHGFPQTLKFVAWIGYKVLVLFGYPPLHADIPSADYKTVFVFLANNLQRLIYLPNSLVAYVIGIFSLGYLMISVKMQVTLKKYHVGLLLLCFVLFASLLGILVARSPSDAYLPLLFPLVILAEALFFARLLENRFGSKSLIYFVIFAIGFVNIYTLLQQNYFTGKGGRFLDKVAISRQIVSDAKGRRYNIIGLGNGSQFASFTMDYQYLTWWLGNAPSSKKEKLEFIISQKKDRIELKEKEQR